MSFLPPVSVATVLTRVHDGTYLLPAIQREFVWKPDQIISLVDSLLRGYPIGSFLLWDVNAESAGKYTYYNFITNYHESTAPFATKAVVPPGKGIVAILDGQQRLTALNIALYGSHAEKKKGAWVSNASAYVKKSLYLNLLESPDHEELGLAFDLRFLSEAEFKESNKWFRVGEVLTLEDSGPAIMGEIATRGFDAEQGQVAFKKLYSLFDAIRVRQPINCYEETDQDADKVLDIFVRVNSGGTSLSYSDLLLSMATNQWATKDAREEVRTLVQELNHGGSRDFAFTKDNVLKSALMISGLPVRFAVSTFTKENMELVESNWEKTRDSLLTAAALLRQFGFNSHNLTAHSVGIVLAYYLSKLKNMTSYVNSTHNMLDRESVRVWINKTILKGGIWGSGLDSLLSRIRTEIDSHGVDSFPSIQLEQSMAQIGKSLVFDDLEIQALLDVEYGSPKAFATLSLVYPSLNLAVDYHVDHIFAKSHFSEKSLKSLGVQKDSLEEYRSRVNRLANLQLLTGQVNVEKQKMLPTDWFATAFANDENRQLFASQNDVNLDLLGFTQFLEFFDWRSERMRARIVQSLIN